MDRRPAIDQALEAFCLKAMALKQAGRSATSKALAGDVERRIADETVSARREPIARRAGRWARHDRTAVLARWWRSWPASSACRRAGRADPDQRPVPHHLSPSRPGATMNGPAGESGPSRRMRGSVRQP
jgi:hypothetical protein